MILSWNAGALAAYAAIRGRVHDDGRIFLDELISGLVLDTPPNQSLLGRVLRDPNFFLATGKVTATRRQMPNEADNWNPLASLRSQSSGTPSRRVFERLASATLRNFLLTSESRIASEPLA
jgi:hypothetical protein